jgi:hypothetical protein
MLTFQYEASTQLAKGTDGTLYPLVKFTVLVPCETHPLWAFFKLRSEGFLFWADALSCGKRWEAQFEPDLPATGLMGYVWLVPQPNVERFLKLFTEDDDLESGISLEPDFPKLNKEMTLA